MVDDNNQPGGGCWYRIRWSHARCLVRGGRPHNDQYRVSQHVQEGRSRQTDIGQFHMCRLPRGQERLLRGQKLFFLFHLLDTVLS